MTSRLYTQTLSYTPEQLYDLVADVESYPRFLPWCLGGRILSHTENEIIADLLIGYSFFRETFRSRVCLTPKTRIDVVYLKGPFESLKNHWIFRADEAGTRVEFMIELNFQNMLFQKAMENIFDSAFGKVLEAFEKRAHTLYSHSNVL